MPEGFTARTSVLIDMDSASVWNALTSPAMIKQYLFGTETECDWKVGSPIFFRGLWEGKKYEDKGTILRVEQGTMLEYDYWSSMSGTPDLPENYVVVRYEVEPQGTSTLLTIIQEKIKSEESSKHSEQNWESVLAGIKKLLEEKA